MLLRLWFRRLLLIRFPSRFKMLSLNGRDSGQPIRLRAQSWRRRSGETAEIRLGMVAHVWDKKAKRETAGLIYRRRFSAD
jgi:hypothetical protein